MRFWRALGLSAIATLLPLTASAQVKLNGGAGATAPAAGGKGGSGGSAPSGPVSYASRFAHLAPVAHSVPDPVNVQRLQAKAGVKGCGVSEVAPGVYVRIDCQGYTKLSKVSVHMGAAKFRLLQQHKLITRPMASMKAGLLKGYGNGATQKFGTKPAPTPVPIVPPTPSPAPGDVKAGGAPDSAGGSTVAEAFPDVVDHRALGLSGPIKNQGSVGSCTSFALSSAVDNALRRAGKEETISPTHIWAAYGVPNMQDAGDYNIGRGLATFETWPYSAKEACRLARHPREECDEYLGVPKNSWTKDPALMASMARADSTGKVKIASFEELTPKPSNTDEILQVLASGSDVWAAMLIDGAKWSNKAMKNAVIPDWTTPNGGHAVSISGYRQTPRGREFMIHNSWGESWGDKGYAWISEAMVKKNLMYGYRVKLEGDQVKPLELTDDDCAWDELVDAGTGKCGKICADDSRPTNGVCPNADTEMGNKPKKK
jgi:hypothetical protein